MLWLQRNCNHFYFLVLTYYWTGLVKTDTTIVSFWGEGVFSTFHECSPNITMFVRIFKIINRKQIIKMLLYFRSTLNSLEPWFRCVQHFLLPACDFLRKNGDWEEGLSHQHTFPETLSWLRKRPLGFHLPSFHAHNLQQSEKAPRSVSGFKLCSLYSYLELLWFWNMEACPTVLPKWSVTNS